LIVALVAIILSPSVIGIPKNNTTTIRGTSSPLETSKDGTSLFFNSLRQAGYSEVLTNSSSDLDQELDKPGRAAFFLIGADNLFTGKESGNPLRPTNLDLLRERYENGTMSFLMAEGNFTDNTTLLQMFHASISGAAIVEPVSYLRNKQVFVVSTTLGADLLTTHNNVNKPTSTKRKQSKPTTQHSHHTS